MYPRAALDTLSAFFWDFKSVRGGKMRMPFMYDEEWFGALKTLYENAETKDDTYKLIDDLIPEGGSMFWKLKEVIENKTKI